MNEEPFLIHTLKLPEKSEWQAKLLGNVTFRPDRGGEPNRFHRFMQRLCFGVVWEKV